MPVYFKVSKEGKILKHKNLSKNITKYCYIKVNSGKPKIEVTIGYDTEGKPDVSYIDIEELNKKESKTLDFFTKGNKVTKDNIKKQNPLPTYDEKCREID